MSLVFKNMEAEDLKIIAKYCCRRPNKTCDSMVIDSFIWRKYYHVQYTICDDKAVLWLMEDAGEMHTAMPACDAKDLPYYFKMMVDYFKNELHCPFKIYLADEEAVNMLGLKENPDFEISEQEDLKDYLYDGDSMRHLSGKKLHKKKNHLNYFLKTYEGRYLYRRLDETDQVIIEDFLNKWRDDKGEETEAHLDPEVEGAKELVQHLDAVDVKIAGVFIDDVLEAFTVGSYNKLEDMAIIHIEKANAAYRGLYQFINQQFLIHEFPEVQFINREDDLGEEGLRKAKMSYNPAGFARKYLVKGKEEI